MLKTGQNPALADLLRASARFVYEGENMTIVAFKSKTEVFEFAENCSLSGFGGRVVATPKEIKLGCGFSVSINDRYAYNAYALVKRGYYPTFHGVYRIKKDGGRVSLSRLA